MVIVSVWPFFNIWLTACRLCQFFEFGAIERQRFQEIIERHDLAEKWESFRRRFLNEIS